MIPSVHYLLQSYILFLKNVLHQTCLYYGQIHWFPIIVNLISVSIDSQINFAWGLRMEENPTTKIGFSVFSYGMSGNHWTTGETFSKRKLWSWSPNLFVSPAPLYKLCHDCHACSKSDKIFKYSLHLLCILQIGAEVRVPFVLKIRMDI